LPFGEVHLGQGRAQSFAEPPPQNNPTPPKGEIELNRILMESTFMIQGQSALGTTLGTVFVAARPIPDSNRKRPVATVLNSSAGLRGSS